MIFSYLFFTLFLLVLIFWQYIRVSLSRVRLFRKIKALCEENGIAVKLINGSYFLAKNTNDSFDFLLKVGNTVIPVKFYSALTKTSVALIDPSGKICIRDYYRKALSKSGKREGKVIKKYAKLPSMKIKKNIISKNYTWYPVFLNEPAFSSVKVSDKSGEVREIEETDALVAGCRWLDRDTLVSLLVLYATRARDEAKKDTNA